MNYSELKPLLAPERLPAMVVDLDALDRNIAALAGIARAKGKRLRLASKSVRVPDLISYIQKQDRAVFRGLMCFSAEEAKFLSGLGFEDLLIAYPTVQRTDLEILRELRREGKLVVAMIDEPAHLAASAAAWAAQPGAPALPVCVDMDLSFRPFGLHLGVKRSPIRSLATFVSLLSAIEREPAVEFHGVMGYEAQIAGLPDRNPFHPLLNPIKALIKWLSARDVARRRGEVARELERRGLKAEIFNGGGTGSLQATSEEAWLTEVTAGSGFLQSHLFDYYAANRCEPAFAFALRAMRQPEPGHLTCQSGGFIASGEVGPEKAPVPYLPAGMKIIPTEGFGEVQTPVRVPAGAAVGDPLLFRPAKAGEIAEHFSEYLLVRRGRIVERVKTYRGFGRCFH
jgi:D-serine deaminase-like pyridoxal phosphate-dependent protein